MSAPIEQTGEAKVSPDTFKVGDAVSYYLTKHAPSGNTLEQYTGIVHDIHTDDGEPLYGVKDGGFYIQLRACDMVLVAEGSAQ